MEGHRLLPRRPQNDLCGHVCCAICLSVSSNNGRWFVLAWLHCTVQGRWRLEKKSEKSRRPPSTPRPSSCRVLLPPSLHHHVQHQHGEAKPCFPFPCYTLWWSHGGRETQEEEKRTVERDVPPAPFGLSSAIPVPCNTAQQSEPLFTIPR